MNKEIQKRILTEKINAAFRNEELQLDTIKEIMQMARKLYALDIVFVDTNKGYKYYLNNEVFLADEEQLKIDTGIALTRKQYQEMVEKYLDTPISEDPIGSFEAEGTGALLHCGIMRKKEYYGTVGFWIKQPRMWTEEEKQILSDLEHLLLIYISIHQLVHGLTPYRIATQEMSDDRILFGFYFNFDTGKCHTMKITGPMKNYVNEWSSYTEILMIYVKHHIDKAYGNLLLDDFGLEQIRKNLNHINPVLYMDFPQKIDNKISWIRYNIELTESKNDGTPYSAIVTITDITQDMQKRAVLSQTVSKGKQTYTVISAVNLETGQYEVYVDNRTEAAESVEYANYEGYGQYMDLIHDITEKNIIPEYAERFAKRFSLDTMRHHFDNSSQMIQYDFPFEINGEEFWVRLEAVRSERYRENNRKVMLYFTDITMQKRREIQLEKRKELLEKENELKKYQLVHDALTGVYNRQGYQSILESYKNDQRPMAYLQIDIDNFKTINDSYGHVFGDAVLKQVAVQLMETFRAEDYVFRFGGDEFAVLLVNCNPENWSSIGYKQRMMHIRLNQYLHKNIYVTLSMGISSSLSGFYREMITLADEALYHTKNNGKAGCSVINDKHNIIFEWNDEIGSKTEANPLAQSATGAYRLEFPHGDVKNGRLICNEITRMLMGLPEKISPEEGYKIWANRIDPLFVEILKKTRDEMIERGQAECTYAYLHPTKGRIMVRSGGKAVKNEEGVVFYGYHQSLQGTKIVLQQNDTQKLIAAMNSLYFCSYYIDLQEDQFYTFKATIEAGILDKQEDRASVAIQNFVEALVSMEHRETMRRFVDLATLQERMGAKPFIEQEYLSITDKGWCRSRFIPVDFDEAGKLTHVQFLIGSIDQSKRAEIEREKRIREGMRLQVRIGEVTSKSKVLKIGLMDKKTGILHIWNQIDFMEETVDYSFEQIKEKNMEHLREEDLTRFDKEYRLDRIRKEVEEKGECQFVFYMRNKEGEYVLTVIHFEECINDSTKYMVVCEDITDARVDYLQGLLSAEQKLMTCVQNLIRITNTQEALNYLLDQIISYYHCDRACLSVLSGEHQGTVVTERCSAGNTQKFHVGEVLTLSDFMQWEEVRSPIKLQKVFCDGDESEEQRWMKEVGLENLMILSFEYGKNEIGYISIDNLKQNEEDSNWIATLAFFIANELQKL